MTSRSDEVLQDLHDQYEEVLSVLKELKERRSKDNVHKPILYRIIEKGKHRGLISQVECSCGQVTKYRVPLDKIEDFKCPKKGK